MSEIEKAVSDYLASQGITCSAVLRGERVRDGWTHDSWSVAFQKGNGREALEEFDYSTGTGHRKSKTPMPKDIARLGPRILARVEWEKRNLKPVAPAAAGVLHSLILDSSAAEQTFASWCDEYGYDTDSRKALATDEACQKTADKMRRIFTAAQIETLRELLQDY